MGLGLRYRQYPARTTAICNSGQTPTFESIVPTGDIVAVCTTMLKQKAVAVAAVEAAAAGATVAAVAAVAVSVSSGSGNGSGNRNGSGW